MSTSIPSIADFARTAESLAIALGQTLDGVGLMWLHHLKQDEKDRISTWSETLDDMRERLRDMMCDYCPVVPPDGDTEKAKPAG